MSDPKKLERLLVDQKRRCHWCACRLVRISSIAPEKIKILKHHFVVWRLEDGTLDQALIASIDHLMPSSRGGRNGRENLVASCKWCNERRSNKTPRILLQV